MKTLGKLKIISDKMLKNEELIHIRGGYNGNGACDNSKCSCGCSTNSDCDNKCPKCEANPSWGNEMMCYQ